MPPKKVAGEGCGTAWVCGGGAAASSAAVCMATCWRRCAACAARSDTWMCISALHSCSFSSVAAVFCTTKQK